MDILKWICLGIEIIIFLRAGVIRSITAVNDTLFTSNLKLNDNIHIYGPGKSICSLY